MFRVFEASYLTSISCGCMRIKNNDIAPKVPKLQHDNIISKETRYSISFKIFIINAILNIQM